MSLTVKNLSKKYDKNLVLDSINFKLNQGEAMSIVGSSGCGKTTLLKCISGLCSVDKGEININLKPVNDLPPNKRNIGYVFQESPLFPHLSIVENIVFNIKKINEEKLNFLLEKIKIKHLKNKYPHEISGGENQRTAVARSLIRNPDLFLLDEPFTNLDEITKEHTKELIFETIKETNTTTILVNHDIQDSLELSDKLLVLDNANIKMLDSPFKVYSEPNSLKTAQLFGELNHIKIKEEDIYVRPHDIIITEQSGLQAKVVKTKFLGQFYKIIAKIESRNVTLFHDKDIELNSHIKLKIKQEKKLKFNSNQ